MSKPVPAGWDGHRVFVRVYGREPSAERLRRMKALWRNYEQEEDREALWQRRERLEETILPSLSRKVERLEGMVRQASREVARREEDEGGWTGDRLKGTEYEPLLAERDWAREQHAHAVEELSVLSAYLDRPAEPEAETDETAEQVAEIARAFRKLDGEAVKGWRYKRDLKDWLLAEFGLSYTQGQRLLEEANVWVKGKKGQPGAGLKETLKRLENYER